MSKFRRVCRWLHRELGFFTVGLTLVYAISGLAVNHAHHWDANYQRGFEVSHMEPAGRGLTVDVIPVVLERLELEEPVKNTWRASDEHLQVFQEGVTHTVNLVTGEVQTESVKRRAVLFDLNFMHLNTGKGFWTWVADSYAVILAVLAITGIFLTRGSKGLSGRGGLLMGLGIALPVIYAIWVNLN